MAIYLKLFNDSSEYESQKSNVGRPSVTLISGNTSCTYSPSTVKVQSTGFTPTLLASDVSSEADQLDAATNKIIGKPDDSTNINNYNLSGISLTMNGVDFRAEKTLKDLGHYMFEGKIPVGFDNKVTLTNIHLDENAKSGKGIYLWYGFEHFLTPIEVYEALNLTINDDLSLYSLLNSDSASTVISTVLESTGIQLYDQQSTTGSILIQANINISSLSTFHSIPLTVGGTFAKPITYQLPLGVKEIAVSVFNPDSSGGTITPIE